MTHYGTLVVFVVLIANAFVVALCKAARSREGENDSSSPSLVPAKDIDDKDDYKQTFSAFLDEWYANNTSRSSSSRENA